MVKEDIYCGLIWNTELNKFIGNHNLYFLISKCSRRINISILFFHESSILYYNHIYLTKFDNLLLILTSSLIIFTCLLTDLTYNYLLIL